MEQPTSQSPGQQTAHRPAVLVRLDKFWQRVTEGLELNQLWKQFRTDARSSYRLYSHEIDVARTPGVGKAKHFFRLVGQFFWAIMEKLTPARRVLLLIAFVLLLGPGGEASWQGSDGQVKILAFDSHFWGGLLMFVLLILEVADRVVMKRDLEIARDIQRWLLPATPPEVPGLAIAFATRPANTVAGDFYDVFARPVITPGETRFLLAVADVAGKSIPAALLMATFQASLRTLSATSYSLAEVVAGMNQYACTNSQSGLRFTTAFLAEFEPVSRTLAYINAGHNAPIVRRSTGAVERLTAGGVPLGIRADGSYESGGVTLQAGDWLVIFTDGLVEAVNEHDEEYGEQRLLGVLQAGASVTPEELLRRMMSAVDAFVGTTTQHDDITCMVVKVV